MTGSAPLPGTARTRPDPRPSTGPVFDPYDYVHSIEVRGFAHLPVSVVRS